MVGAECCMASDVAGAIACCWWQKFTAAMVYVDLRAAVDYLDFL
jgi:hypothetical protein